jgi:hypothetical protein
MLVGGANRIAVDAPGGYLLPVASLQSLVYAEDEWTFPDERL